METINIMSKIKVVVLPELVYKQYISEGVELSRLDDLDYMLSVSTVGELIEICDTIKQFPNGFNVDDIMEIVESPITRLKLVEDKDFDTSRLLKEINTRLETLELRQNENNVKEYGVYTLKQLDEYFWVVVQKSLPMVSADPVKESIDTNHSFINDMVSKVLDVFKFESLVRTNLFRLYLDSSPQAK